MIKGKKGNVYDLPPKESMKGGEGKIYILPEGKVLKIYNDIILEKDGNELESKLNYMVDHPPRGNAIEYMAWPLDVVYEDDRFCGFIMNDLSGFGDLVELYRPPVNNNVTFSFKLTVARNMAILVSSLHNSGYIVGDFNPRNFGYDMKGNVYSYDVDSFQFSDDTGHVYRCNVQFPGYVAPELMEEIQALSRARSSAGLSGGVSMRDLEVGYTKDTDRFALAVHIYQLMNDSRMPLGLDNDGMNSMEDTKGSCEVSKSISIVSCSERDAATHRPLKRLSRQSDSSSKISVDSQPDAGIYAGVDMQHVFVEMYNKFFDFDGIRISNIENLLRKALLILNPGEHRPSAGDWIEAIDGFNLNLKKDENNAPCVEWADRV